MVRIASQSATDVSCYSIHNGWLLVKFLILYTSTQHSHHKWCDSITCYILYIYFITIVICAIFTTSRLDTCRSLDLYKTNAIDISSLLEVRLDISRRHRHMDALLELVLFLLTVKIYTQSTCTWCTLCSDKDNNSLNSIRCTQSWRRVGATHIYEHQHSNNINLQQYARVVVCTKTRNTYTTLTLTHHAHGRAAVQCAWASISLVCGQYILGGSGYKNTDWY